MNKRLSAILSSFLIIPLVQTSAVNLSTQLKGKILLQTESHGEAWYVRPDDGKKYYLKDGATAYAALRAFGLGISNANIAKIPVGLEPRFQDTDTDGDGLPDQLEDGLGTKKDNPDSDGDSYSDSQEIQGGYSPLGTNKLSFDTKLVNQLKGKILLQTESHGEAWYVRPDDGKRYYMKNGEAAYQIMRYLSLGITNADLNKIQNGSIDNSTPVVPSESQPVERPVVEAYQQFHNQLFNITSLKRTLTAYHYSLGKYPSTLTDLITTSNQIARFCQSNERNPIYVPSVSEPSKIQCGDDLWNGLFFLADNNSFLVDWVTNLPYQYSLDSSGNDYKLVYNLNFYECEEEDYNCIPMYEDLHQFINGKNTATKDYISADNKLQWEDFDSMASNFQKGLTPEPGIPVLSGLTTKVYPQASGNKIFTYVTLTWQSDIDTEATIAYGHTSQQTKQEYFRKEDQDPHLRKNHRIDFYIEGDQPVHYVIQSCFVEIDIDYKVKCVRTDDAVIKIKDYPTVINGPSIITNTPTISNIKFSPSTAGTTISWNTYPDVESRIFCIEDPKKYNSQSFSTNYTKNTQTSFSQTFSLVKGLTYACSIDAWYGLGTVSFPIIYTVPN